MTHNHQKCTLFAGRNTAYILTSQVKNAWKCKKSQRERQSCISAGYISMTTHRNPLDVLLVAWRWKRTVARESGQQSFVLIKKQISSLVFDDS